MKMNTLIEFNLVLKAVRKAAQLGHDLSELLVHACKSESFTESQAELIARFQ